MDRTATPRRRHLLCGAGGLLTAALAGCTGSSDDGTPDPSPTTTERATVELSAPTMEALDQYTAAAEQFDAQLDRLEPDDDAGDVRTDEIDDRLEYGTEALEEARADASAARRDVIETLLLIGAWLRELTDALSAYRRGTVAVDEGRARHDDGKSADAVERFDEASSRFQDGIESMEAASTAYERIDVSPLERVDGVDHREIRSDLASFRERAAELGRYLDGMDRLARAAREFSDGRHHYEAGTAVGADGDYQQAAEALETARDAFEAAGRTASAGEAGAPDGVSDRLGALACAADAYRDATDHMLTAMSEAEAGDEGAAEEAYEAALEAETTAEEC